MEEIVTIERLSDNGAGVAHTSSGLVLFVRGGVPGDLARVFIDKQRSNYSEGHILELLESSTHRTQPLCPFVEECGGCAWQQISYPLQLQTKRQIVVDALSRIAHLAQENATALVAPTLASPRKYHYRNKIVLAAQNSVDQGFQLGFRRQSSHVITKPGCCLLAPEAITESPKALRGALRYAQGDSDLGIFSVSVRHSRQTHQTEVAFWTEPGPFKRAHVANIVGKALKATSIVRVITEREDRQRAKKVEVLAGSGCWKEKLTGLTYLTSAPAFFQINSDTAELLISEVEKTVIAAQNGAYTDSLSRTNSKTLRIADLYAGGGTFSLPLAHLGHEVIAVESVGASVRDLRRNAELNDLELEVEGGDVARILPKLGRLDILLVDPPRAGLAETVIDSIAAAEPQIVIYISCNPATWARDVARLEHHAYLLQHVQPVDQFPQTPHVELISIFKK